MLKHANKMLIWTLEYTKKRKLFSNLISKNDSFGCNFRLEQTQEKITGKKK